MIEVPFRRGPGAPVRALRYAAAAMLATLLIAAVLVLTRGGDWRLPANVNSLLAFERDGSNDWSPEDRCFMFPQQDRSSFDRASCLSTAAGKPNYWLIGDSLAARLLPGLSEAFPHVAWRQATASGCRPVVDAGRGDRCEDFMREVFALGADAHPAAVFLAGRWNGGDLVPLAAAVSHWSGAGATVFVLGPIVEYRLALPRVLALAALTYQPALIADARVPGIAELDREFDATLRNAPAVYISLYRTLCPSGGSTCTVVTPAGTPVQFDYGHPTRDGSVLIGSRVAREIARR